MYYILFKRVIQAALANRVISNGDGVMGLRVVTGVLEATGDWKKKGGTTTFEFWRIHDAAGNDHFIKHVRVQEYMRSHALPGVQGSFVFSTGDGPVAFGMKHVDGQIVDDLDAWKPENPLKHAFMLLVALFLGWGSWMIMAADNMSGLWKGIAIVPFLLALVAVPLLLVSTLFMLLAPHPPSSEELRKALAEA